MIRLGILDFDTSHCVEFTRRLNHVDSPEEQWVEWAKVVVGCPGESKLSPERIPGFTEEDADAVLRIIDELTVEDAPAEEPEAAGPTDAEMAEVQEVAAEILALPMSDKKKKKTAPSDAGE